MKHPLYHLLIPNQYRVWCVRNRTPGTKMALTRFPSKATCVNCLTAYRYAHGHRAAFAVKWTSRHEPMPHTPPLEE